MLGWPPMATWSGAPAVPVGVCVGGHAAHSGPLRTEQGRGSDIPFATFPHRWSGCTGPTLSGDGGTGLDFACASPWTWGASLAQAWAVCGGRVLCLGGGLSNGKQCLGCTCGTSRSLPFELLGPSLMLRPDYSSGAPLTGEGCPGSPALGLGLLSGTQALLSPWHTLKPRLGKWLLCHLAMHLGHPGEPCCSWLAAIEALGGGAPVPLRALFVHVA